MSVDIIILHKCTKNHDHMPYCSWNTACGGCNFCFSFWAIFCPFTLFSPWKKRLEVSSFYTNGYKNYDQIIMITIMVRDGRTDGRTDGQTARKSDIDWWVSHLKIKLKSVFWVQEFGHPNRCTVVTNSLNTSLRPPDPFDILTKITTWQF